MLISCDAREMQTLNTLPPQPWWISPYASTTPIPLRRYRRPNLALGGFREASASRSAIMRQPPGRARLRGALVLDLLQQSLDQPRFCECSSAFRLGATYCASSANIRARNYGVRFVERDSRHTCAGIAPQRRQSLDDVKGPLYWANRAGVRLDARPAWLRHHDGSAPNLLYFSDTLATKYQGVWSSALVLIGSFASSERESVPSASAITSISWLWEGNNMVDIPQEYRRSATGPAGGMIAPPTGAERSPMPARGRPRRGAVAAERSREAERTQTDTPREQVDGLQEQIVQLRAEAETAERAAISR
jgi:hypothetical protein